MTYSSTAHFVGIGFDRDQTKVARLTLCGIDSRWTQRGDSHLNLLVPFWYRYLQYFNLYLLSMRGPLISLALFSEVEPKASQSELRFMGAPDNQVFRSAPFWMVEDDPHGRRRPTKTIGADANGSGSGPTGELGEAGFSGNRIETITRPSQVQRGPRT
jgi:hypothetical protein